MKRWILVLAALGAATQARADLVLNFANEPNATITFNGSSQFSFPNGGPYDFEITTSTGGTGSANGLKGNLSGTYTIGAISTFGILETAPVTGSGTLSISDGTNTFSSTLNWVDIESVAATGGVNYTSDVNMSGFSYAGSNADLVALYNAATGIVTATYQFSANTDLKTLVKTPESTSYSGSITASVPEPASILLLGTLLIGLGRGIVRRRPW